MEIHELIKKRRTVREFVPIEADKSVIDNILEAGRLAPSAKNRQPWRFIAIIDKELKGKMRDLCYDDARLSDAAAVIVLCTTNLDYRMPNGQLSYPMDIACASSFMMIQAQAEGWGSAMLSTYQEEDIQNLLRIPYSMRIPLILLVGKSGEDGSVRKRFDAKRTFSYDHW